jgi:hypothetical protein
VNGRLSPASLNDLCLLKLNSSVERLKCSFTLRHPVDLPSAPRLNDASGHRRILSLEEEAWKCLFAHTSHVKTEAKAVICSVPAKLKKMISDLVIMTHYRGGSLLRIAFSRVPVF